MELARILYSKNATVYIACRSESKARDAITIIQTSTPESSGRLEFLQLQLDDLTAVAKAAREFLSREKRLDVLFNNAGVMHPPEGSKTVQGHELQLGVHNLGHGLFTELLTPMLVQTAKAAPRDSVRVVWASSLYAEMQTPRGGFDPSDLACEKNRDKFYTYSVSKAGVFYQGAEYARRHKAEGIVSVVSPRPSMP
jgi:retinol dehydrogenase 12